MELRKRVKISKNELNEMKASLPPTLARRAPTVYQLAYLATNLAIENQEKPQAIICVSALGCLDETISFLDKLDASGLGSPKDFVFSTHNSLGAMLAKEFEIKGANFTICGRFLDDALEIAEILDEKTVLIVEFDDSNEFAKKVLRKCGKNSFDRQAYAAAYLYSK